jgi:site-specific DNA recombinase
MNTSDKTRVIGYIRVSTDDQNISPEMQADKIRAYCEIYNLDLVWIEQDLGISAKDITHRPGFKAALDSIFYGKANGLIVWKFDRAFRSTMDALEVCQNLNKAGKKFISICEQLDTSSAIGEFFFTLLAALAQMERKLIGERTKAALQQKKKNGERVGSIPMGWELGQDGKTLVADKIEQEAMVIAKDFNERGFSLRKISERLANQGYFSRSGKCYSPSSVAKMIEEVNK